MEDAERKLITWLGDGAVEEEAWTALKQLSRGSNDTVDLSTEAV